MYIAYLVIPTRKPAIQAKICRDCPRSLSKAAVAVTETFHGFVLPLS